VSRLAASFSAFLVAIAFVLFALPARAATPRLRTTLSAETIEVGDSAVLTLSVTPGDQVTEAQMTGMPSGLSIVGQSMSPAYQVTVDATGQMTQVVSQRVQFRIRGNREGTYTIGPPSVTNDGKRVTGDRVALKVVAKGTLPPQQVNPFDPFNMFGRNPFGIDEPLQQQQVLEPNYPIDPKLSLDRAPTSAGTFLHAVVDKGQVVVGEQVTLSIYVYADVTQSDPELQDPHEPGTSDFLRQSLLKNDQNIERSGFARVGGKVFAVALLRKYALFPLHAGELEITPMRLRVTRLGERASETIKVRVTEPPIDHRPAGYTMGDVGHFTVTAEVAPREVERGGAVAVTVELSGWGNLPTSLTVPARPGVTWLDPEVKEDLHLLDLHGDVSGARDVWGGSRRFSYVVSPTKEGDIDLGEIVVAFYDPRTHAYDTTRAVLGTIHVKPRALPVTENAKLLANMPQLRSQRGDTRAGEAYVDDSNVFWGLLGVPSALFAVAVAGRRFVRRVAESARERKTSPLAELKQRQRALATAVEANDGRTIDGASIRVLEAAATAHVGVNVRGVGGEAVASVLEREGVEPDTAAELRDLLEACAAARFSPDGVELDGARERASHVRALVDRLESGPQSARPSSGGGG
jgi:hypothetical protein